MQQPELISLRQGSIPDGQIKKYFGISRSIRDLPHGSFHVGEQYWS
jgi:hypothetical protein